MYLHWQRKIISAMSELSTSITTNSLTWWESVTTHFLDDCLEHINVSMHEDDPAQQCASLFSALNRTWDAFHFYRSKTGTETGTIDPRDRSDYREILDLFTLGATEDDLKRFVDLPEISQLAHLSPQIMNHQTLRESDCEPNDISDQLAQKARREHRQLLNAYDRYKASPPEMDLLTALLQKLAHVLYIVRNNTAHGEKSTFGPDVDKAKRDANVYRITAAVINRFFDMLFRAPNTRFAAYGTLRPGESNHFLIAKLGGEWISGTVTGTVTEHRGFPRLVWHSSGEKVNVEVLHTPKLSAKFEDLDAFEGRDYERIWVPVELQNHIEICNIYAKATRYCG
jgi:gamma-glutamylcyclotransferase (GGCT)/AIG2-like uncharacterized protein YtfP